MSYFLLSPDVKQNMILILSDSNEIRTHNHLVCKPTLNHVAKLASLVAGT